MHSQNAFIGRYLIIIVTYIVVLIQWRHLDVKTEEVQELNLGDLRM